VSHRRARLRPFHVDGRRIHRAFLDQKRFQRFDAQNEIGRRLGMVVMVMLPTQAPPNPIALGHSLLAGAG
jgi:hypothetical protein